MCDHAKCYSEGHAINVLSFLTESGKILGGGGVIKNSLSKMVGLNRIITVVIE